MSSQSELREREWGPVVARQERINLRQEGEITRLRAYLAAFLHREPDHMTILRAEEWHDLGVRVGESGAVLATTVNQVYDPVTGSVTLWLGESGEGA